MLEPSPAFQEHGNPSAEQPELHAIIAMQLCVFGRVELVNSATGVAIPVGSKKGKALLAFLATAPRFTASRARVAALLWSESLDEQARQSLRQLLSTLRRSPQASRVPIVFDDSDIGLDSKVVAVDVASLLTMSETASLSERMQRIGAYRGPFAMGLDTGESEFDDWLRSERQRLDDMVIPLMDRLVRDLARANLHQDALAQANVLFQISRFREETHRLVIAQEAIVSGRASAMKRYEDFRLLLRDELAVRPEPATQQLIEQLRNLPSSIRSEAQLERTLANNEPAAARVLSTHSGAALPAPQNRGYRHWLKSAIAASVMLFVVATAAVQYQNRSFLVRGGYAGEADGRVTVAVIPFEESGHIQSVVPLGEKLHREVVLAFYRNNKATLLDAMDAYTAAQADSGRLRARYLAKTYLLTTDGMVRADVSLIDASSGRAIWSGAIPVTGAPSIKFAREFYGSVLSEITLDQSRVPDDGGKSLAGMLWRARAAQIQTRLGTQDQTAVQLYRAVLEKDPKNLVALLGLSDWYILRVARNETSDKAADVETASDLLLRAKPQAPNSSDIAFKEGMLNKLQGQFERASSNFQRAMRLDPAHWNAAAQYAHVMIFLGRMEEGFTLMEPAAKNLLPDLGMAETAYIAGETALVSGHTGEAVRYLSMAVEGNPTVGRIHALRSAALELEGRPSEATAAAALARNLNRSYTPEAMARRGGTSASPQYIAARTRMVEAYRRALGRVQLGLKTLKPNTDAPLTPL